MTSEIFGYSDRQALQHRHRTRHRHALTNILREYRRGYRPRQKFTLPMEDLKRFNYSEEEFMKKTMNDNFLELMKFQIERASCTTVPPKRHSHA